jgi:hypothetical protein
LNSSLDFQDVPDAPDSFSHPSYLSTSLCTVFVSVLVSFKINVPLCCLFFPVFRFRSCPHHPPAHPHQPGGKGIIIVPSAKIGEEYFYPEIFMQILIKSGILKD